MRAYKLINWGVKSWYNTKFSRLFYKEIFGSLLGELQIWFWELKGQGYLTLRYNVPVRNDNKIIFLRVFP